MEVRDCVDAALTLALPWTGRLEKQVEGKRGSQTRSFRFVLLVGLNRGFFKGTVVEGRHGRVPGARPLVWNRGRRSKGVIEVKRVSALHWGMKLEARPAAIIARASCAVAELE